MTDARSPATANLLNVDDFERAARGRLQQMDYDYYAAGALDELTLGDNRAAYRRIKLRYRVFTGVAERELGVEVLGCKASMPIFVAPTAFHGLATADAELATARAAGHIGTIMTLSTIANSSLEEVREVATSPLFFQLYVYQDRAISAELVQRAEAAGYKAILITADTPILGTRERDVRNNFHLRDGLTIRNLTKAQLEKLSADDGSGLASYFATAIDQSFSWQDLEWLRGLTDLPILVKGVVHPADARLALEHGAAGVVVSNHGGRQLDTSIATIDALPAVADEMAGAGTILLDGGIRRGTDVIKALALGADAVFIGRPILWGLAVDGENGALRVLEMLRAEFDKDMALAGFRTIADLKANGKSIIVH